MNTESIETVIIGAGQAGLSTGYHLRKRGRSFVILDGNVRIGDQWRAQWDTLRLYTPIKYDGLPGLPFPGDPWGYPTKDEVAEYLTSYVDRFDLPVRSSTRVERLESSDGRYVVTTGTGTIHADNVVVATGTFGRTPYLPDLAVDLDPAIRQLHSSEYRRPEQLQGRAGAGRRRLALGHGHRVRGRHQPPDDPLRTRPRPDPGPVGHPHGARLLPDLPVLRQAPGHPADADRPEGDGRDPVPRRTDAPGQARGPARARGRAGPRPGHRCPRRAAGPRRRPSAGGGERGVGDRVQAGLRLDPAAGVRVDGWPSELRGVVTDAPGLFFCGLSFQFAFSSMVLPGVGRDAAYVANASRPDPVPPESCRRVTERASSRVEGVASDGHCRRSERARRAYERRDWAVAYEELSAAADETAASARTNCWRWPPPPT